MSAAAMAVGARDVAEGVRIDIAGLGRRTPRGELVLDGVSFSVTLGELVAIVGGSGTGDS